METKICTKGINFMKELKITPEKIQAVYKDTEILFDFESKKVSNCNIVNNELVLEVDENTRPNKMNLCEMRIYVQNQGDEDSIVFQLEKEIRENINLVDNLEDMLCVLPDLPFIVPRGKYTADIYKNHLKLHGSSYNYTLFYNNMRTAFLLPMPDAENVYFVIHFDKPLRQGQTIYKYIIINFKVEMEIDLELRLKKAELKKIDPTLKEEISGKYYEVFAKLFKAVSNINIVIPGNFETSRKENSVKCSIGARQGSLFFLSQSILFVPKPIKHIKFKDILRIELHRIDNQMSNRNFDLEVMTKNNKKFLFSGIDKTESEIILKYLKSNKVLVMIAKIKNDKVEDDSYMDESIKDDDDIQKFSQDEYGDDDEFIDKNDKHFENESDDEDYDPEEQKKKKKKSKKSSEKHSDDDKED